MFYIGKIVDWFREFLGLDGHFALTDVIDFPAAEYCYRRFAVEACVNLIAHSAASCTIETYEEGAQVRGLNYWLLNYEPNRNQNGREFMRQLVSRLLLDNEALAVMHNDMLYVADDFGIKPFTLYGNVYEGVRVGDLVFERVFHETDVLHLTLNDANVRNTLQALYGSYGKLLAAAESAYKRSNAMRVVLMGKNVKRAQSSEIQEKLDEMYNKQYKDWFAADKAGALIRIDNEQKLEDMSGERLPSRDIRALMDDVIDFTCAGFGVPRSLLMGETSEKNRDLDKFLTFTIKPLAGLIETEINRKMYGRELVLKKTYAKIDAESIKITDLQSFALAADKLFSIGAFSVNDVLERLGRATIDEGWADKRYITKNYEPAELRGEGGEGFAGNSTEN